MGGKLIRETALSRCRSIEVLLKTFAWIRTGRRAGFPGTASSLILRREAAWRKGRVEKTHADLRISLRSQRYRR